MSNLMISDTTSTNT